MEYSWNCIFGLCEIITIFDLDGTLFDTSYVNYYAYKAALKELRYDLSHSFYVEKWNGKYYKDFLPLIVLNTEEIEKIHKLKKKFYCKYLDKAVLNEHLFAIIESLRGKYHMALVTTASRANCMDILNFYKVSEKFDLIIMQEDVSKPKPDPEGYQKAMKYFSASPEDFIIFEDSEDGIQAALESGACLMKVERN